MAWNVRGLKDDRGALVRVLRGLSPDVLALTEPPRGPFGRARLARFADASGLVVVARVRTCALLVRADLPTTGARQVRLPWTPGLTRRGVAVGDVAGVRVHVVHLGIRAREHARHTERLARLVAASPGPCVVAGDLNEGPSGSSWRSLRRFLTDLAPGSGPTYPAAAPRLRIDAVLGRGLVAVGGTRAAADRAGDLAAATDHLPVTVDLVLR